MRTLPKCNPPRNPTEVELCFIPFNTACALEASLVDLSPSSQKPLELDYIRHWGHELFCSDVSNMDQVRSAKDRLWRTSEGGIDNLLGWFLELVKHMARTGHYTTPQLDDSLGPEGSSVLRARVDPILLRCAWWACNDRTSNNLTDEHFKPPPPGNYFREKLEDAKGRLVETHLHINSTLTSEIAWCCTVCDDQADLPPKDDFKAGCFYEGGGGGSTLISSKGLIPWLWWARVARLLLWEFQSQPALPPTAFLSWCTTKFERTMYAGTGFTASLACEVAENWKQALMGSASKWYDLDEGTLGTLLALLRQSFPGRSETRSQDADGSPIDIDKLLWQERRWIVDAFSSAWQRLASEGHDTQAPRVSSSYTPTDWDRALLQYVRVRNLYHRHLTLHGRKLGFAEFYTAFRRGSTVVKRLLQKDSRALGVAFKQLDPWDLVDRVEFRHATRIDDPGSGSASYHPYCPEDLKKRLASLELFEKATRKFHRQGGLIFHFNKKTEVEKDGSPLQPSTWLAVNKRWRLGPEFAALLEEACALSRLWRMKGIRYWIVGFDVANTETFLPNWPFLALFRKLRREMESADPGPGPGFTFHAGECFELVLTGLHRIGQVIEFLSDGMVDGRIGHGLALNPNEKSCGHGDVKNEDWAMALCWAYKRLHHDWIESEAQNAVEEVRSAVEGDGGEVPREVSQLDIESLALAYNNFGAPDTLAGIGFPFKEPFEREINHKGHRLTRILLSSANYRNWAKQTKEREDASDEVLNKLRSALAKQAFKLRHERGINITIEACPASNLAIGIKSEGAGYALHPAVQAYCHDRAHSPWRVSINTDNPLAFGVDLATEYQRMSDAVDNLSDASADSPDIDSGDRYVASWRNNARLSCFLPSERKSSYDEIFRSLDSAKADPDMWTIPGAHDLVTWWEKGSTG